MYKFMSQIKTMHLLNNPLPRLGANIERKVIGLKYRRRKRNIVRFDPVFRIPIWSVSVAFVLMLNTFFNDS